MNPLVKTIIIAVVFVIALMLIFAGVDFVEGKWLILLRKLNNVESGISNISDALNL